MANFYDLAHRALDLAHKAVDAHTASADDEPDAKPTPTKNPGLHPGEGKQIDDLGLLKDPNDPR